MLLTFLIQSALAGPLDPSSMLDWNGQTYINPTSFQNDFAVVVKQLSLSTANQPSAATTLGIYGFEMILDNRIAFIDSTEYVDGSPSPWNLMSSTEESPPALWLPNLEVRKGLPLSLEMGLRAGMVVTDVGSTFGSYVRCAPLEGYRKLPDIALQFGYAGYIGNPDLALGTMDTSITIGKALPFGPLTGINSSVIHPYASVGMYWTKADPRLNSKEATKLDIQAISAFQRSDNYMDGYRMFAWNAGFEIQSNEVVISLATSHSPNTLFQVRSSIGYSF